MWSDLFEADFPGVVTTSVSTLGQITRTFPAHWWKEFYKQSEDFIDVSREVLKLVSQTTDASDIDRNTILIIDAVEYLVVAVNHDGHGISTMYLEIN